MLQMNQISTAYGLKFANELEMKLFQEYTDFERTLSEALIEVTPLLERERTEGLKAVGHFLDYGMKDLVLAFMEAEEAEYNARYLLKEA